MDAGPGNPTPAFLEEHPWGNSMPHLPEIRYDLGHEDYRLPPRSSPPALTYGSRVIHSATPRQGGYAPPTRMDTTWPRMRFRWLPTRPVRHPSRAERMARNQLSKLREPGKASGSAL